MKQTTQFGASLSIKQCRAFNLDDQAVLRSAIKDLGITHFRLMSYWDEIETVQGTYDFSILDKQVKTIAQYHGTVTMCLGVRQPRWPESHWPRWATMLPVSERNKALFNFIRATVERYQQKSCIVSWQLENEALLKSFGEAGDFDRTRLRHEYELVKKLDPARPVIMTTSTSWGIPFRKPIPDIVGFSFYRITHSNGAYRYSIYQPWVFKLRAKLIQFIWRRPSFIHELQAEPWGPRAIREMHKSEQAKSMNPTILSKNIQASRATGLSHIDLWGLEWWYANKSAGDPSMWNSVKKAIK